MQTSMATSDPAPSSSANTSTTNATTTKAQSAKDSKAQKQAEKQARRTAVKTIRAPPGEGAASTTTTSSRPQTQVSPQQQTPRDQKARTSSQSQGQRPITLRPRRPSNERAPAAAPKEKKEVSLFGHLHTTPKTATRDVHPAILALGLQMSTYVICGSSARCVAMLLAFKQAIMSYTTPSGTSLSRHMPTHYLGPQIDHLKSHRPISVGMGNAIRWLKKCIGDLHVDLPETQAKIQISTAIDGFIQERLTAAGALIATTATTKIKQNSTIAVYAKSSLVQRTLLQAHATGKRFRVNVIDSRPLFEGRNLARTLSQAGIKTSYTLVNAAGHALRDADLVLLGAHAMMANGRLCSRVGTASVAMLAHNADVPVIVLCESVKFAARVALDSIVMNELASPDELLLSSSESASSDDSNILNGWRNVPGLQLLNIMHDVTPADYIDMVITEYGSLPPTSVPVVFNLSNAALEALDR